MRISDLLQFNLRLLLRQRFRSAMSLLAMAVGVAAVLLLTGLGEGARQFVLSEFSLLGSDVLIMLPGRKETTGGMPPLTGEGTRDITLEDVESLRRLPSVRQVAPLIVGNAQTHSGGRSRELLTLGTSAEFFAIRRLGVLQGQPLPAIPLQRAEPVCVLGTDARHELFGSGPVLGEWLRIGDRRFRVIGVLDDRGESMGMKMNDAILIPVASAQQVFDVEGMFRVFVRVGTGTPTEHTREAILALMQERHGGERDVTLITQDALLGAFDDILKLLTLGVGAIAAISLLVAGILIMNITLISVSQRTREIGLLKALGASAATVRRLFISEALQLALLGSLLGAVTGYGLLALGHWLWPVLPFVVSFWALVAALIIATGTALLFAWVPASRAAGLPPVLALQGQLH
ncbi:multidrug ABC transporter substrate-binding protein [Marinobacterium nitratireducens]|uniref:Multidrug ABC transporter substrate-binding protein n=1 Tax=Marinobacterium nitratireducens TaxID=518897 RepID=A0A918DVL0_9GAMM|nr:ABC transporter permease [Marinobacterium nitratireducens]GGO86206.1 multidrug ABC transporter substrate-binding protein [Marinobacterium nitratireducens]